MLARSLGRRLFSTARLLRAAEPPQNGEDGSQTNFQYRYPWKVLKAEFEEDVDNLVPSETDILIIGGGIMGCSTAYWLRKTGNLNVTILERDSSYTQAATPLSVGGLRQQFSEPENIQMSLFSAEFFRHIQEHLSVLDHDPPDIQFTPHGYLTLATENGAEQLVKNFNLQREFGADVELMTQQQLKERWPWMNVEDIDLGCYGISNEGWFDPWLLLSAIRRKVISLGVTIVHGELTGFEAQGRDGRAIRDTSVPEERYRLTSANVRVAGKEERPIKFATVVNAAGPWAQKVAHMAGIGPGGYAGGVELPVEQRLRSHFVVRCPSSGRESPGIDMPWIRDISGLNVRRKDLAGHFIVFQDVPTPSSDEEPNIDTLEVDYTYFEDKIWPALAHRIPPMEAVKIRSAWAGYYDFNYADQNLIIGNHPYHQNFIFCNGSSGHGIQHALAIGRAVTELVVFNEYKSIDLKRLSYDRLMNDELVFEKNII